jgi:hypothetical protein
LRVNTSNAAYENYYLVTVRAKLYAESSRDPFITFEIYLHPHPCIKATLSGSNPISLLNVGTNTANAHAYNIAYQETAKNREFVHFTASVGGCTPLKYSITTGNASVLALLRPGGSGASLISTSPMAFTQTGARANLQFNPTINGALMGAHTFNMEITMNRFPEMNSFTKITRSFVLTITSACTTNAIIPPSPDFPKNL